MSYFSQEFPLLVQGLINIESTFLNLLQYTDAKLEYQTVCKDDPDQSWLLKVEVNAKEKKKDNIADLEVLLVTPE